MSSPFFQSVTPSAAPDSVTPADSPSDSDGWDGVTPSGVTPAPYDINAPQDIAGIAAAVDAAGGLAGAGIVYPRGPRQGETESLLMSPQGAASTNVLAGFPDYEYADIAPGANMENPDQGMGDYPGTMQDGVPMYGTGGGIPGVTPEGGSMDSPSPGYPGTTQDGVQKYGTS